MPRDEWKRANQKSRYGPGCRSRPRKEPGPYLVMTFGKHKGHALKKVPLDYLVWVLDNCALSERIRQAIAFEVNRRRGQTKE